LIGIAIDRDRNAGVIRYALAFPRDEHLGESMADHATFLKTFLRHPTQVGAIAPSSAGLVDAMVQWIDWDNARTVVEFGPGTGVFTEAAAKRIHADGKFFAIERSADLADRTRLRCPGVTVYQDRAQNIGEICRHESVDQVDAVICGLPWAAFPESLQTEIMDAMLSVLKPGGQFATFAYWQGVVLPAGIRFSRRLRRTFSEVRRSHTVWKNLPPAFVYRCIR
jgi:phospholipid N-methyltransferase